MTDSQPTIYVDADACPVKEEAVRVADRHGLTIYFVANARMRLPVGLDVQQVTVSDGFDAADDWIAERAGAGDVVITEDTPLAERCLTAGAQVLRANGKPFTPDNIGMSMAMRELSRDLRDMGEISGAGPSFTKKDRSRFLEALELAVRRAK
ncbi:MAG: YaiI/YqxD family protein [Pseudomonadota bacterium]